MRIIFIENVLIIFILILYIILPVAIFDTPLYFQYLKPLTSVTIVDTLFSSGPLFLVHDSSSWINIQNIIFLGCLKVPLKFVWLGWGCGVVVGYPQ